MAGLLGDEAVHLLGHPPVGGMALWRRAELEHVHRLAGVHLHREADVVRERDGVAALVGEVPDEGVVQRS